MYTVLLLLNQNIQEYNTLMSKLPVEKITANVKNKLFKLFLVICRCKTCPLELSRFTPLSFDYLIKVTRVKLFRARVCNSRGDIQVQIIAVYFIKLRHLSLLTI